MSKTIHVAINGCDHASGSVNEPLRTMNCAASRAVPGDTVCVHAGEYRECVDPRNGGLSDIRRITYEAAAGEHVVIKGSEVITDWEKVEGSIYKKVLDNRLFGTWNPFAQPLGGDWLIDPKEYTLHMGEVYVDGVALYEVQSLEQLKEAKVRETGFKVPWNEQAVNMLCPERSVYQWYTQVDADNTTLWCNFQQIDPNQALIEVNVRKSCFAPSRTGINYLTVRGFEMAHGSSPWAPPTGDQPGMLSTHWSKGWIIENNHLHDAKCCAISIGKEESTGHNLYSRYGRKPGYQYQMESVFLGIQAGWCKEKIGSHVVRDNVIHDCGQNGIVGHMGGAFCKIIHNHIYNIGVKREFFGYEIGGIKLHAAVDTIIEGNNIHHCELGTWLDWQAQGTRVTGNVYHHNDRDLMIEVTHGPCLVDNNIFASAYNFDNVAQGTAYVHNLCCGFTRQVDVLDRSTPYHFPHTTQIAGCAVVYGGDDRLYNNLFTGQYGVPSANYFVGTAGYDRYTTPEEYPQLLEAEGNTDEAKYYKIPQPMFIGANAYAGLAKPFRAEDDAQMIGGKVCAEVSEQGGVFTLEMTLGESVVLSAHAPITTSRLGMPRITEEAYENPDGTPIDFTRDISGEMRAPQVIAGPFASLACGESKVVIWSNK